MTPVIVLGALLGVALLQLRWMAVPPAPDLVGEIDEWRRARDRATARAGEDEPLSPMGRITRWVIETLRTYRPELLEDLNPDLAITRRDLQTWLTRVVGLTLTFALGPTVLMLGRRLSGHEVSLQWAPVVGLVLGGAAVYFSLRDLRQEATRVRAEYTRGLSIYLDLVALSMEAGQGHASALPAAAQVGTGRVFAEIRTAMDLAPSKGITAWEALGQIGERYRIPELISLRSSIELAQEDGARVKTSLISRADTMRKARLSAAVEQANNATNEMKNLTMVAAVLAGVYIAVPYILALRTAAGAPG